jgi:hypothetical protein
MDRCLKWNNDIIGTIDKTGAVIFSAPAFNKIVALYTCGETYWPPDKFNEFLSERVISRERRDIEARFTGYRFSGALDWIRKTIDMITDLWLFRLNSGR